MDVRSMYYVRTTEWFSWFPNFTEQVSIQSVRCKAWSLSLVSLWLFVGSTGLISILIVSESRITTDHLAGFISAPWLARGKVQEFGLRSG